MMSDGTTVDGVASVDAIADHPQVDPQTGWNRLMVEQMARSIKAASAIRSSSWCIHNWGKEPVVAVEMVNIGSVGPNVPHGLMISTENLNEQQTLMADGLLDKTRVYSGRPWAAYLRIPEDQVKEVLENLEFAHIDAVERLARDVKSKAMRWKWHREDFRQEFERIAGVSIPEPGYMQELEDLQTQATNSPISSMYSQTMVDQMARSILAAHELTDTSWSLFETNKQIALNVGQETVGGSNIPGMYDFVVDTEILDSNHLEWLTQHEKTKQTKSFPSLLFVQLPDNGQSDYFADLQDAHQSALKKLTVVFKKATLWKSHREDLRKQIENISGVVLPVPSYVAVGHQDWLNAIQGHYGSLGLHYTQDQIAMFYTALQTKGFVVLSGISGTGKSKIAQGFVDMMPGPTMSPGAVSDQDEGLIRFTLKPYTIKYKRVILPARQVAVFPDMEPGRTVDVVLELGDIRGTGRIENRVHTNNSLLRILYFRKDIADELARIPLGHEIFLDPEMDEDGETVRQIRVLTTPPTSTPAETNLDEGESRIGNHLFLSVRPDWRDSTSLLGYFNPLTQTYEWTDFLRFILRAAESYRAKDGLAWFVILDEMNLAHVEYYFADLLSVIESGRQASGEDAGFTREPLRTTFPDTLDDEVPPREIFLPPNLYIIGTVNMDETTHAFSPKVLDRAFTIELAEVDFSNYPVAGPHAHGVTLTVGDKGRLLAKFTRGDRFALIDKEEIVEIVARHPRIRTDLQALNGLLRQNRMHFGYRLFDEICQYLFNNDLNGMLSFKDAFDRAVFMKVLPKFTGSRARLQSPLHGVLTWAIDPGSTSNMDVSAVVAQFSAFYAGTAAEVWTMAPVFPTVAERARDMLVALERDGFVSFG